MYMYMNRPWAIRHQRKFHNIHSTQSAIFCQQPWMTVPKKYILCHYHLPSLSRTSLQVFQIT